MTYPPCATLRSGGARRLAHSHAPTHQNDSHYHGATLGKGKLWRSVSYNAHPQNTAQAAYQYNEITSYDAVGRPTNGGQWFLNSASQWVIYPMSRSYDLATHVTQQNYPSTRAVNYSYGADGRLSDFTGTLGDGGSRTYADTMSYNAAGQMLQERFVTGTQLYHTMQYNQRFQMWDNRLGTTVGGWSRGALFTYYSVTARNSGNPAAEASGNNGNVWMQEHYVATDDAYSSYAIFRDVYEYDDLNRIKRDTGSQKDTANVWTTPHQQGFTYDQWGNRTIDAAQTFGTNINNIVFGVNTANNRLTGLTFDTAGNVTTDNITGAGLRDYDAENRMTKANGAGGLSYYGYDASGQRVRRITGGVESWYVYGFDGELIAEYPVNGAASSPQREYGYRNGQMLVAGGCDTVRWIVADHLGSPRIEVDVTGSLASVRRHDYLPFGEELIVGMGNGSVRSTGNGYAADCVRQKFTAYERDDETGLDFAQARYFGSLQGRFTSPDPYNPIVDTEDRDEFNGYLGQPQNWNRYAYVWNNPLKFTDPNGENVYVVSYTYGNSNSDESFKRAAETLADEIRKQKGYDPKKDTVLIKGVYAKDDFQSLLKEASGLEKQFGKVEQVTLFAHAGAISGPVFHDRSTGKGTQFTDTELKGLKVNWSPGTASACFLGCNTANNFTQSFANAQGVPTYGYDKYAYFSSNSTKMVPNPKASGSVYLIAADYGTHNGLDAAIRYKTGNGRVYPLVRRDPQTPKR